jgi:hypothetical protein
VYGSLYQYVSAWTLITWSCCTAGILNDLVKKEGWAEVKQEKIADYAGDYIVSTSEGNS